MKLTCEGCNAAVKGETADAAHAAMMAHGAEAHSKLWDGKSPDEIQQMEQQMAAHVRQMIADQEGG